MNKSESNPGAVVVPRRKKSPVQFAKAMQVQTPAIVPAEVMTDTLSEDVNFSLHLLHKSAPSRWSALNEF